MFDAKIIDIKSVNTFFSGDKYAAKFKELFVNKQSLKFGDYLGKITTKSIEPIFAVTSDIQYQIFKAKATAVNWFEVQHILLVYIMTVLTSKKELSKDTLSFFSTEILKIKKSDGKAYFTAAQIKQVLTALNNNKDVAMYKPVFSPGFYFFPVDVIVTPQSQAGFEKVVAAGVESVATPKKSNITIMIAGAALAAAGLYFLSKKNKKKGR